MQLQSRIKRAHGRCYPPEETIRRLEKLLGSRHAYRLIEEEVARHLYWTLLTLEDSGFRAMGKGLTAAWSKAGALAEAAEWLACLPTEQLPGYETAHQDEVEEALPIESLLSHVATATPPVLRRIKILPAAQHWVTGHRLPEGRPVKVPLEYVRVLQGPNGRASGNVIEEALAHAVLEIFERRVQGTVLRRRLVMPSIDPDSLDHPVLREQLAFLREQKIRVTLKDLSFGDVLPCVGAYFEDPHIPDTFQFHHFFKVGASFDSIEALMRVFTEYAQGRRRREFLRARADEHAELLRHDFRALRTAPGPADHFLTTFMFGMVPCRDASFLRKGTMRPFLPKEGPRDCLEDITRAARLCERLGKECIAVNLSDPAMGFPVVQVVVPGYSDVLPFHPPSSPALFRALTRDEAMALPVGVQHS